MRGPSVTSCLQVLAPGRLEQSDMTLQVTRVTIVIIRTISYDSHHYPLHKTLQHCRTGVLHMLLHKMCLIGRSSLLQWFPPYRWGIQTAENSLGLLCSILQLVHYSSLVTLCDAYHWYRCQLLYRSPGESRSDCKSQLAGRFLLHLPLLPYTQLGKDSHHWSCRTLR